MLLNHSVMALILLLAPMFYLLLAFPAFLLVRLDIPQVAYVFRSVLFGYFLVLAAAGFTAAGLYAIDGRFIPALCIAFLAVSDLIWRRWTLRRVDVLLAETQSGVAGVGARMRRMHWAGMAANAVQLCGVLATIPLLAAP
jgi:hypothetical protein